MSEETQLQLYVKHVHLATIQEKEMGLFYCRQLALPDWLLCLYAYDDTTAKRQLAYVNIKNDGDTVCLALSKDNRNCQLLKAHGWMHYLKPE